MQTVSVTAILDLGLKDHSLPGNGIDASDRDNAINIANWPVFGMYQPDAIASYEVGGQLYLVTANEGDARDYEGFAEEARVNSLTLDPEVFPNAEELQANANLGRLTVTNVNGQGANGYTALWVLGGRSFTIWNATTGAIVADSGDDMEQRTAQIYPANFNASNTSSEFDNRSDNKGPEPEGVVVGEIDGRFYAFIGLERIGGVMVYDVTVPAAPTFVRYINNRDFNKDPATDPAAGDLGPEGLTFVSAADSPAGVPLLLVASEISGSVTIYAITSDASADGAGRLTLLHNNDGESDTLGNSVTVAPNSGYSNTMTETLTVGSVAAFKSVVDRERNDARSRGNAVVNVYAGDAFLASADLQCTLTNPTGPVYDAIAQQRIGYTAHALGNHEFDYTPDFLKRFIDAFGGTQPFLSANLDFSGEPSFASITSSNANGILFDPITDGRVLGSSLVYTDTATGQRFGIVGITTPLLPTISSPRNVTVTPTITETATVAQQAIDNLDALGVRKIILVSHLQDAANDIELIQRLTKVDIAVGGGGDELLTNPNIPLNQQLLPGDSPATDGDGNPRPYPLELTDAADRTVYLVTSNGNYKYSGRLDVVFDADGEVSSIVNELSYLRRVVVAGEAATNVGIADAVAKDAGLVSAVETPVQNCLTALENEAIARSELELDVSRAAVRSRESNLGNLITDAFLDAYSRYADNISLPPSTARVIAIQNGGGIRQNAGNLLPRPGVPITGTITALDTFNVLPFVNFITVVQDVTPTELASILERSAASLPGEGGQFLQIAGFRVEYVPSRPAGSRVRSATLADGTQLIANGEPVAGAPNVTIVTNSFTANGGDNYATLAEIPASRKINLVDDNNFELTYEQPLREYLQRFPASGDPSLPTIPASDLRYAPGGEGRITFVQVLYLPIIAR